MPGRSKDKYGQTHSGKHKYISVNFQRQWEATRDSIEVKTQVELEQGNNIEIETEVPISGEISDRTIADQKEARRKKILENHPDRGGSEEALKKVLDEEE